MSFNDQPPQQPPPPDYSGEGPRYFSERYDAPAALNPSSPFVPERPSKRHSIAGIISIIAAVLAVITYAVSMVMVVMTEETAARPIGAEPNPSNPDDVWLMLVGATVLGAMVVNGGGVMAALVGYFIPGDSPLLPTIGLALNLLPILGCFGLCLLGLLFV